MVVSELTKKLTNKVTWEKKKSLWTAAFIVISISPEVVLWNLWLLSHKNKMKGYLFGESLLFRCSSVRTLLPVALNLLNFSRQARKDCWVNRNDGICYSFDFKGLISHTFSFWQVWVGLPFPSPNFLLKVILWGLNICLFLSLVEGVGCVWTKARL